MKSIPAELAPCGVYCGACPSFNKSCLGCASENKDQKRKSKWGCKIRECCYTIEKKSFCIECDKYPCDIIAKKLLSTHQDDPRFKYRYETPKLFPKLKKMGIEKYLAYQKKRWTCPSCKSVVCFYIYKCSHCGEDVHI